MGELKHLPVVLERDLFLRKLLRHLSGAIEDVVGLDEASGLVSVVGRQMGREMDGQYREALGVRALDRAQVADVLVDLKARIEGDFYVISQDDEKIVLGNRACPFGEYVEGRPALCMMTSNVFGSIAAANLGWAKVTLEETIAEGAAGCRVVVWLQDDGAARAADGREYFGAEDPG
ncbi:MAG: methanogen output domain 1-containing protein [Myxococcota bacterium]|nr:methanogen output domain 1-containing protein [Myxococcota bacterium]